MRLSNVHRFFLLTITITASVVAIKSPARSSSCHPEQRDALSRFNNSFSIFGPPIYSDDFCMNTSYPKTASWRKGEDCCSWGGVTCDNSTGDIVGLDLSCAWLQGTINSSSPLFYLRHLRSLSLAGNDLLGSSIPPEICVFSWITHLNLSSSSISGIVPTEISQLSKLVSLDLSRNIRLEMKNPTMGMLVTNLTELEELSLSHVDMSAIIPTSLMNFSSSLISLYLSNCWLGGKFPDYIFRLSNLQHLDLFRNPGLHGTLPWSNWSSSLGFLSLGDCSFSGEVPHSIGSLLQLTSLDLSGNNFTGHVNFEIFSTLKNLRFLDLSWLSVSGEDAADAKHKFPKLEELFMWQATLNNFPCFLSSMPELRELDLQMSNMSEFPGQCVNNGLSFPRLQTLDMTFCNLRKFPSLLSHSKKLRFLYLRGNMIAEIPSWFWGIGIDTLEELDIEDNLIKGRLRLPWKRLAYLYLRNNSFEGPFPIPTSRSIIHFILSQNDFNGSITPSICQLISMSDLKLGQNNLTGVIPQCLSNLTNLSSLDLSHNSLTGPLPLPSYAAYYYSVSNNNFSGEISSLICNATNLRVLDLSSNGLTDTLPHCLKNIITGLQYLNLRANRFHGLIPEIFPQCSSLMSLDFSRNQFEGSLPRSLSNCQGLEVLDVGSNKIVDVFPSWLGDLPLKVLSLRSNKFYGRINISVGTHPFSEIRVLDLSNNSFDGNPPDSLLSVMSDMMRVDNGAARGYMIGNDSWEFYSVMTVLKGVEMEMVKINVQFATLDMSSNRFWGEIPRSIGLLKSLKGLNFSHNGFTGTIPPSVGNLTNLESLDLSCNHLVGGIPKELVQLSFLGALNLSRNNLTGPIPLGGHFNTFLAGSFEGNPGLCGTPLLRACSQGRAEAQPPPDQRDDGEDEPGGWFEWKFVAMGFGSGMVIGISLGYMALETGRPLWLARMVIRLEAHCRKRSKRKASRRNARR